VKRVVEFDIQVGLTGGEETLHLFYLTYIYQHVIFIIMEVEKAQFVEKILNTPTYLNYLGKNKEGDSDIDRFNVELKEISKSTETKDRWSSPDMSKLLDITMYLNTDKEYISCDDLWFYYNLDPGWWEAHIIPNGVLKLIGETKENRDYYIKIRVRSNNGKYKYCEQYENIE